MNLEIDHLAAIQRLVHTLPPEGGGVVVFHGRNGCGKSTALDAIDKVVRGTGRLTPSDDAQRGRVALGSASVTFTHAQTRHHRPDAFEVVGLSGRLNITKLIDPGIDDPVRADAERIKTLVGMLDAPPDFPAFVALAGSEEPYRPETRSADDLLEMARLARLDLHAAAQAAEKRKQSEETTAVALQPTRELGREADEEALRAEYRAAVMRAEDAKSRRRAWVDDHRARVEAQERLAALGERPNIHGLEDAFEAAQRVSDAANVAVEEAMEALRRAEQAAADADHERSAAKMRLEHAKERATRFDEHEAVLKRPAVAAVPDGEEEHARAEADRIEEAMKQAAIDREDRQKAARAAEHRAAAAQHAEAAARFRSAAAGVDDILTEAIASRAVSDFRVKHGRLVVPHGDRGLVPMAELSEGERCRKAIDVLCDVIATHATEGRRGIGIIDQAFWESLDDANTDAIVAHATAKGIFLFTAQADAGDLHVEVLTSPN